MQDKLLLKGIDYSVKEFDSGAVVIIHHTDKSLKRSHKFINDLIKSLGLVEQGFHLLPE